MDSNKQRDKVRKLLALAESNNPYEAERALSQAKKIMAKYNIRADDTEIITVKSSKIPRRHFKVFETHMVNCVNAVSGCEAYYSTKVLLENKVQTSIYFVGLSSDANMAAYSFEVLHTQVLELQIKMKKDGYKPKERNRASLAWSISACEKLKEFFDYKEIPENVKNYYSSESKKYLEGKSRSSEKLDQSIDNKILNKGYISGSKARLNKAATHQKQDSLV